MQKTIKKIAQAKNLEELETLRVELLGKKGKITTQFAKLKDLPEDEKKQVAKTLNKFRDQANKAIDTRKDILEREFIAAQMQADSVDVTLFDEPINSGALHPVMATMDKIIEYFVSQNFSVESGPLIENDFHNFEALNIPKYHPARDMQDTFYLNNSDLLRTHTSGVQIRTMLSQKPPIRMIAPGAVFRRDMDLTHVPMFHQVEGLVVENDDSVSFANLKDILENFLKYMFGNVKVRFRPSFFP
nr:phenylalanine--tRNA ligase subunit alpha [Campylobacter sp.]